MFLLHCFVLRVFLAHASRGPIWFQSVRVRDARPCCRAISNCTTTRRPQPRRLTSRCYAATRIPPTSQLPIDQVLQTRFLIFFFFFTITVDAHSIDRRNMAPSPLSLAQGGIFLFAENSFHLNTTRKLPCVIKRKICIKRKRGGGGGGTF